MNFELQRFEKWKVDIRGFLKLSKSMKLWLLYTFFIFLFNSLTANDELSRLENLTFLCTWIMRYLKDTKSFTTHACLCNTLSSNKLYVQKQWKSWQWFRIHSNYRKIQSKIRIREGAIVIFVVEFQVMFLSIWTFFNFWILRS